MPVSARTRVLAAAAAATALTLGVAGVASASDDSGAKRCRDFPRVLDAQAALDLDKVGLAGLDVELGGLANGIACDLPRHDEDEDDDHLRCSDFDDRKEAQEALDDDEDLAVWLDGDGDGVACERLIDDDSDGDDEERHHDSDGDESDDDDSDSADDGGQVKVHPNGGVDTGGAA